MRTIQDLQRNARELAHLNTPRETAIAILSGLIADRSRDMAEEIFNGIEQTPKLEEVSAK